MEQTKDMVNPPCFNCQDEGIYYNGHFQAYEPCVHCDTYSKIEASNKEEEPINQLLDMTDQITDNGKIIWTRGHDKLER
jgi:hypothetical protein